MKSICILLELIVLKRGGKDHALNSAQEEEPVSGFGVRVHVDGGMGKTANRKVEVDKTSLIFVGS